MGPESMELTSHSSSFRSKLTQKHYTGTSDRTAAVPTGWLYYIRTSPNPAGPILNLSNWSLVDKAGLSR